MSHRGVAYPSATWTGGLGLAERGEDPAAEARLRQRARDVLARAQAGDGAAFREIFDLHVGAVHGFLRDLLGDGGAADEATQDVFLRAYDRLETLHAPEKLRPWLLGIARNVALELWRAHRRQGAAVPLTSAADEDGGEPALEVELLAPTPEALLLDREAHERMTGALAVLSEERRAALLLRIDHALPYQEIAEVLGWSLAKVKVELHRARLQLRAALIAEEGETP